jgi:hypothetical protein
MRFRCMSMVMLVSCWHTKPDGTISCEVLPTAYYCERSK